MSGQWSISLWHSYHTPRGPHWFWDVRVCQEFYWLIQLSVVPLFLWGGIRTFQVLCAFLPRPACSLWSVFKDLRTVVCNMNYPILSGNYQNIGLTSQLDTSEPTMCYFLVTFLFSISAKYTPCISLFAGLARSASCCAASSSLSRVFYLALGFWGCSIVEWRESGQLFTLKCQCDRKHWGAWACASVSSKQSCFKFIFSFGPSHHRESFAHFYLQLFRVRHVLCNPNHPVIPHSSILRRPLPLGRVYCVDFILEACLRPPEFCTRIRIWPLVLDAWLSFAKALKSMPFEWERGSIGLGKLRVLFSLIHCL